MMDLFVANPFLALPWRSSSPARSIAPLRRGAPSFASPGPYLCLIVDAASVRRQRMYQRSVRPSADCMSVTQSSGRERERDGAGPGGRAGSVRVRPPVQFSFAALLQIHFSSGAHIGAVPGRTPLSLSLRIPDEGTMESNTKKWEGGKCR
ncbi:hypothetical protein FA10DRAFT_27366 [Acaromyces ingoldii]|uniref:Uncharacterized protein n=1 Tax=Acaromyces ingoldii TaxID=215250 RepID=A0A316YVY4_9BASI|nr:hypothetical protein FA10DRAFT_27366 [Acaromyces ingoldii]PWN93607.1 hypothetical protein FA10DRAFT_27366 [Acaromyces ingoldii]